MKLKIASLLLAIGACAAIALPASAGDLIDAGPGVKLVRGGSAVPVPAPRPIENYPASWYFRFDAALGFRDAGVFHEKGYVFGTPPPGSGRFRTRPAWFDAEDDIYGGFGVGVGYRFSSHLRGDITVESRSRNEGDVAGRNVSYQTTAGDAGTTVAASYTDNSTMRSVPVLFNLYWDLQKHWGFTPYVGAGLGFSVNEIERSASYTEAGTTATAAGKSSEASLAAMATVGVTYAIDPMWALDFNYRFLYVGGSELGMALNGQTTTATFSDQTDHQLRAGVRLNIY